MKMKNIPVQFRLYPKYCLSNTRAPAADFQFGRIGSPPCRRRAPDATADWRAETFRQARERGGATGPLDLRSSSLCLLSAAAFRGGSPAAAAARAAAR